MGQPTTNQAGFRGRNDDGSETAATWKAILDTNWTQLVDAKFRVRFLLTNTGDKDEVDGYRLYYSHNSGTYTRVTTTSSVIKSTASANTSWTLTDGDDTTQQLGSGTFDTGDWDNNGQADSFTLVQAHETELEWCLTIDSATVGNGDSIELRVYFDDDTVLDNYLTGKTPNITVSEVTVVNFSATLVSVTTTPDTGVLAVSRAMSATLTSATTTSDTATLDSVVNFQAATAAHTSTPGKWWDPNAEGLCVWAAYAAKGAASLAASYTDLSGESHNATVGVAPDWDAVNGWKFNGVDDYLKTGHKPDLTTTVICQFSNWSSGEGILALLGCYEDSTKNFLIYPYRDDSGTAKVWNLYGTDPTARCYAAPQLTAGNLCLAPDAAYRNGSSDGTLTADGGTATYEIFIGALNNVGSPDQHGAVYVQAVGVYDCTLTAAQVAAIESAMAGALRNDTPATLSVTHAMSATVAAETTTPDTVAAAVIRELLAILAAATTTPDNAILSVPGGVVSFLAVLASATTTPDAATVAVIRELLATLASTTATPDTVILAVSRALDAVLACETTTPDTAAITAVRELIAELASTTATPDTVALDKIVALLATLAVGTTTPDTTLLALSKAMVATLASATTTPDTAILSVAGLIEFLATLASTTTTPDVVLAVTRELVAVLASATTTPDAALSRVLEFVAVLDSTSTTPDSVVLGLSLELLAALAASTTTPDSAVIGLAYDLAAALAAATTTPDDATLSVGAIDIYFSAILAAITTAPDDVMVNVARELAAVMAAATTSPDDAELYAFRIFLAALASATITPDVSVLDLLLGSGAPIGVAMQRPGYRILTLGNLGAVQILQPVGFIPNDVPQSEADALIWLYNNTNGSSWTDNTGWLKDHIVGNWFGVTVAGGHVDRLQLITNNLSGNIAAFDLAALASLSRIDLGANALTGDIGAWPVPATYQIRLYSNNFSGDLSTWTIAAGTILLNLNHNSFTAAPSLASNTSIRSFTMQQCGLTQAAVDSILQGIYNRRMSFAYSVPVTILGGTNAAPGGTYQDGDPPTTGKEYIYEVCNDPEVEGFNTWTITYNNDGGGDITRP